MSELDNKRWYVVQAQAGFEMRAKKSLSQLIETQGLQSAFGEILIPTESVIELKGGKKSKTNKKFFPGYLLVEMVLNEATWSAVMQAAYVSGFVGKTGATPVPITQKEAENILNQLKVASEKPRHRFSFLPGEAVRVKEGPFSDFTGVVERVDYTKDRLQVLISIFGRATPIELSFQQVAKEQ